MVNPLKKDLNKPSPYNGGVVLCRIALFFLIAAALAFVWRLSCEQPGLKAQGVREILITEKGSRRSVSYGRRTMFHTYYSLKAVDQESGHEYSQSITKQEYNSLAEGETYYKNVFEFETKDGYFISWDNISDEQEAARVYYSRFPTAEMVSRSIVTFFCLGLAVLNAVIGLVCLTSAGKKQGAAAVTQPVSYEDLFEDKQSK